jgi:hypothetical protein
LKNQFQDENRSWDKRWHSFTEGYEKIESTADIEDYFYEEDYVKGAIYSWKTDKIPQQIFTWNVGGYGQEAVWYAQDLLDAYRLTLTMEIA